MLDYRELTERDVGRSTINAFGRVWMVSGFIGHIRPEDVGKRIYQRGSIIQVENDEQRAARLANPPDTSTYRKTIVDGYRERLLRVLSADDVFSVMRDLGEGEVLARMSAHGCRRFLLERWCPRTAELVLDIIDRNLVFSVYLDRGEK